MTHEQKKQLLYHTIGAALTALLIAQPGAGFMVIFLAPALFVWMPFTIYSAIRHPHVRRWQATRILVWLVALLVIIASHHLREQAYRQSAEELLDRINDFSLLHGRYPASLEEIGLSQGEQRKLPGRPDYVYTNGKPFFFYRDTMRPFGIYIYDFKSHSWHLRPD
jgi:hypothetical protein